MLCHLGGNQRELARIKNAKKSNEQGKGKRNEDGLSAAARKQRYVSDRVKSVCAHKHLQVFQFAEMLQNQCSQFIWRVLVNLWGPQMSSFLVVFR